MEKNKTAIKLLNNYAENYNKVREENFELQEELNDIKTTLLINKELIKGFVEDKIDDILVKNTIKNLSACLSAAETRENSLKAKLSTLNAEIALQTDKIDSLIQSKPTDRLQSEILTLKCKLAEEIALRRRAEEAAGSYGEASFETWLVAPTKSVLEVKSQFTCAKNELACVKKALNSANQSIERYVRLIEELQHENSTLRLAIKTKEICRSRREVFENLEDSDFQRITPEMILRGLTKDVSGVSDFSALESKFKSGSKEVQDALKSAGLSKEAIGIMSNTMNCPQILDLFEFVEKSFDDRNMQIDMFRAENELLNKKIQVLLDNLKERDSSLAKIKQKLTEKEKELIKIKSNQETRGKITINNLNINKFRRFQPSKPKLKIQRKKVEINLSDSSILFEKGIEEERAKCSFREVSLSKIESESVKRQNNSFDSVREKVDESDYFSMIKDVQNLRGEIEEETVRRIN